MFAVLYPGCSSMCSSAEGRRTVIAYTGVTKKISGTVRLQMGCVVSELFNYLIHLAC